ncbi:MAG: hypothetical protein EON58_20840 [Alphaproteobacteria bacterium]|nr:MAG: hypothetical protein EON58_20840 [Alphaproteobacteria bacterium]
MTIAVEDYAQPVGSTRDCQNRRLTETVYVDVSNILRRCVEVIEPELCYDGDLTEVEKAALKT